MSIRGQIGRVLGGWEAWSAGLVRLVDDGEQAHNHRRGGEELLLHVHLLLPVALTSGKEPMASNQLQTAAPTTETATMMRTFVRRPISR